MTQQQQNKTAPQGKRASNTAADQRAEIEAQNRYWREQFRNEPYYNAGQGFETYEPAYRTGIEGRSAHAGRGFDDVEDQLRSQYEANAREQQKLDWSEARQAVRAAWERTDQSMAGANKSKAEQQRSRH